MALSEAETANWNELGRKKNEFRERKDCQSGKIVALRVPFRDQKSKQIKDSRDRVL